MNNTTKAVLRMDETQKNRSLDGIIDTLQLKKAALIIRAINHPLRQKMLQLLHKNGTLTVTELYVKLRLEQSVASQHLAILRKAQFVVTQRKGKQILYSIKYDRLNDVQQLVGRVLLS